METGKLKNKFVAVLNKKISVGKLMNALAHMSAGLSASYPNISEMRFDTHIDKNDGRHSSISDHGFIILSADNSNQIRTFRKNLMDSGVHFVDFTDTMTVGTFEEQKERTKNTLEENLEYYGVCAFGAKSDIDPLTKRFSLWK